MLFKVDLSEKTRHLCEREGFTRVAGVRRSEMQCGIAPELKVGLPALMSPAFHHHTLSNLFIYEKELPASKHHSQKMTHFPYLEL
jgi:hypothetical protein